MKTLDFAVLLILSVMLGIGIYFFWLFIPQSIGNTEEYSPFIANLSAASIMINTSQFYPNMRFADSKISYSIESACNDKKVNEISEAFNILAKETILNFYEDPANPEIEVICSQQSPSEELVDPKFYIAGEGGPTEARNLSTGYLIMKGSVSLFKEEKCPEPKLALHEILHALGFDHNTNQKSVMYPITNCAQTLDAYIVNEINRLYSFESLPDLGITKISANRTFYGLSFSISVINTGFKDAKDARVDVFADNEKVANYSLGVLQPGMTSKLEVTNLRAARRAESVKFFTTYKDDEELQYENNVAELTIIEKEGGEG